MRGMHKTMIKNHIDPIEETLFTTATFKDLSLNLKSPEGPEGLEKQQMAFAESVRVLRNNWRQGSVSCLGRSDVTSSNKKPWKQKGTGRARAGSVRSPLWRGGGVTFGPQARSRKIKLPKKVRRVALSSVLFDYINGGRVLLANWKMDNQVPKTKKAFELLCGMGLNEKKVNLFLSSSDNIAQLSFSNIVNVRVLFFDQPNVFDVAYSDVWVVLKKDLDVFAKEVARWI